MRVGRAFAFIDLSGFTGFTDANGDEEAGRILTEFRTIVRSASSRRGVRVAKWQGDGAMFVAVERGPLVEAVLEIEYRVDENDSPLRLRAGLTWGHVILFEGDDYIGSAVNLAARLCDTAEPHEILATVDAAEVPRWAVAEAAGPVVVRGFAHPVPVLRLRRRDVDAHPDAVVTDPVCELPIPRDAIAVWRGSLGFCARSCAETWDDAHRGGRRGNSVSAL